MTEPGPSKKLQDGLISQDVGISDTQLKEFRMQLEQSLNALEKKAQSSQRATICAIVAVILCSIAAVILNMGQGFSPLPMHIVAPLWTLCTWGSLIAAGVLIVRYWTQHRPALERGRTDLQIAMFNELQRQMTKLAQRLDNEGK